jgi:hypothetical protein
MAAREGDDRLDGQQGVDAGGDGTDACLVEVRFACEG